MTQQHYPGPDGIAQRIPNTCANVVEGEEVTVDSDTPPTLTSSKHVQRGPSHSPCRLIAMDFDGTLWSPQTETICPVAISELMRINPADAMETKTKAQAGGIPNEGRAIRVVATGRNYMALKRALSPSTPLDYIITGSGAMTMRWPSEEIVEVHQLPPHVVECVSKTLCNHGISFHLLRRPPNSHSCIAFEGTTTTDDFPDRNRRYKATTELFSKEDFLARDSTSPLWSEGFAQFLLMATSESQFNEFVDIIHTAKLSEEEERCFRIVRATSPFRGPSILWLEILPKQVGKSHALATIAARHGLTAQSCVGVGNDYNDLDLLEWCGAGYLVSDAHEELKKIAVERGIRVTKASCSEGGVAEVIRECISTKTDSGNSIKIDKGE